MFFFLGYGQHFFDPPSGIHYIRQTDSLSFVDYYYHYENNFFAPGIYNQESYEGKSACEFPILYYFVSLIYHVFGRQLFILKVVNLILAYVGILSIYKISLHYLKDHEYSIITTLFIFTSTVFNYYSFNYLPDLAAFGFISWGIQLLVCNDSNNNKKNLFGIILITCGALIKITFLIAPIALLMTKLVIDLKIHRRITLNKKSILGIIFSVLSIFGWNLYVLYYNNANNSTYFTTSPRAIWSLDKLQIDTTWDFITHYWYNSYLAIPSHQSLTVLLLISIVLILKVSIQIRQMFLWMILGSVCYFILFFSQFKDHDYYSIELFPLVITILITGIYSLIKQISNKYFHIVAKILLVGIVIYGMNFSRNKLTERRLFTDNGINQTGLTLSTYKKQLQDIIPAKSKVLLIPDLSMNGGFLAIERKGWILNSVEELNQEKINYFTQNGMEYIILLDTTQQNQLDTQFNFKKFNIGSIRIYSAGPR